MAWRKKPPKDARPRNELLEEREPDRSPLAKYVRYSHVGLQFFLAVGIFTWGGIWLDKRLGTVVLFTLLGLALGFAGGFLSLYFEVVGRKRPSSRDGGAGETSQPDPSQGKNP